MTPPNITLRSDGTDRPGADIVDIDNRLR